MDRKLSLIIQFAAIDKLSGAMKGIIGLGKTGAQSLAGMSREQRDLNRQIADYDKRLKGATGNVNALWNAQKKLIAQSEVLGGRMARQKQFMAIDSRTAAMTSTGKRYVSEGTSTLMWGAMLTAPVVAMAREAGEVQALTNKLRILGLGDAAVKDLYAYAEGMNVAGSSIKDNLRYILEAQGAFRETGAHTLAEQLAGAKLFAPIMAKMQASAAATGKQLSEEQERYFLRFVEQAGGMNDPRRAATLADGLFRALQSSGGNVSPENYQAFMARAGTSGMKLSARSFFADFEPLIAELHDSAGVGLMSAWQRLNGVGKGSSVASAEMLRLGLWDRNKVNLNSLGGVKSFVGGQNPMNAAGAATLATDPVEFYRKFVLPTYQKNGITDVVRENALIFGRTGGALFNLIDKQLPTILKSRLAYNQAQGLNQAYGQTQQGFFGAEGKFTASWKNFMVAAGSKGGVLDALVAGMNAATVALRGLTQFGNANPTAFKWIGTALTWLLGLKLAGAGVKIVFGGLLGPVAQLWGLWSKFGVVGGAGGLLGRLAGSSAIGSVVRGFTMAGSAVLTFGRAFGLFMLTNPVGWVIALATAAFLIYRNWGTIGPWFAKQWHNLKTIASSINWAKVGTTVVRGIFYGLGFAWKAVTTWGPAAGRMLADALKRIDWGAVGTWIIGKIAWGLGAAWGGLKSWWTTIAWPSLIAFVHSLSWADVGGYIVRSITAGLTSSLSGAAWGAKIASALGNAKGAAMAGWAQGTAAATIPIAGKRARGGPVEAGRTYLVGENGPEPFTPGSRGMITPNHRLRGMNDNSGGLTVNITVQQRSGEDSEALARRVAELIRRDTAAKRRGSYLDA